MATKKPKAEQTATAALKPEPKQAKLTNECGDCAAFVDRRNIGIGECRMNPPHAEAGWPKLRSAEFCLQFKPK